MHESAFSNYYEEMMKQFVDNYRRLKKIRMLARHANTARKRNKNRKRLNQLLEQTNASLEPTVYVSDVNSFIPWFGCQTGNAQETDGVYWNPTPYMPDVSLINPYFVGRMPLYV